MPEKCAIFWFRRDLRLYDNTGLFYALREDLPVLPIFIFDKNILDELEDQDDARVTFIHEQVGQLKEQLEKQGSSLKAFYDTPEKAFKQLLEEFEVAAVYTNRDYEPYAKERYKAINNLLQKQGIPFYTFKDQVIFEKEEITSGSGDPYKVFTPYSRKWREAFAEANISEFPNHLKSKNWIKVNPFPFPTLEDMGFTKSNISIPPVTLPEKIIKRYDKTRNFPAIEGTSKLGIHLRHGTLSIRRAVLHAAQWNDTWLNELIWREFYAMILAYFPHVVDHAFKPKYDHIPWRNNEAEFKRWCEGKTGYPIVDAGMRELNTTGYMHNRVRMIVASFLTKHLLIDWRWGEAYFARKLLDYELASNNGGWQWAAGTGTDAQPYFRIFNPYSQTEKFDPKGEYIRKWVPEVNTEAYPEPIVPYKEGRERALAVYKEAVG